MPDGIRRAVVAIDAQLSPTFYEIGRMIVENEQNCQERAEYGKAVLKRLSAHLTQKFGKGGAQRNLEQMRQFYLVYENSHTNSADTVCAFSLCWSLTDAGYQGLEKHEKTKGKAVLVAMRPGKRKLLSKNSILSQIEYLKSQVRAKVEHPFHWLKCIFGLKKLRYRGLYKNAQMLYAMFGFINLCQNKKLLINSGA